ncbi:Ig-like domain-containing protein [Phocaeicola plebeius]|uniref:Bacterial surface proteins containing Ig-like domains n=1 Tax=Phocaeicola plebeius CAG:211 TaxID=1263052 RepID=R5VSH7_9BACT|nr:Ig-like domain-containing protein [Phocaeicola plebeius]CCZ86466.1 bacterial surface proteins containing Ig-like domains [Phocaeicola plebeius CAG:211]
MAKYHLYKIGSSLLCAAVFSVLCSCENNEMSELSQVIYPEAVNISVPDEVSALVYKDETGANVLPMLKGEVVGLGHSITPENVTFKEVAWSSSDEAIATVDATGTVKAISGNGGSYSIIQVSPAVFYAGSGIFSTLKVVVSDKMRKAESIVLTSEKTEIYVGEDLQLDFSILPENATYKTVKWTSSDETVATVDSKGLVTAKDITSNQQSVTITGTALDGSNVSGSIVLNVLKTVQPESITIDPSYSKESCVWAITDKQLSLNYSTVPENCTTSLIEWSSSDENIATVENGTVVFNQDGNFGDVTITALCPATGNTSSIVLRLEEGLVRELYHDKNNYTWYDAKQSGSGTSTSHIWSDGKITITTYTAKVDNQRADLKCYSKKTWMHAGKYPIFAVRMDDVRDKYPDKDLSRNITVDGTATCNGITYKGSLEGANKWEYLYKCSDGSSVFVYDLSSQRWSTGGVLPTNAVAEFTALQIKYADIKTLNKQIEYNVYWVQTFKSINDVKEFVKSEGLTINEN